jgi:hypothetical protein
MHPAAVRVVWHADFHDGKRLVLLPDGRRVLPQLFVSAARARGRAVRGTPPAAARSLRGGDPRRPAFLTQWSRSVRDSVARSASLNHREHNAINKRGHAQLNGRGSGLRGLS